VFTGTEENSTTSRAHLARIAGLTPEQVAQFRNRMPAFDRESTPTGAGRIAEELRTTPGAVRSGHPQSSFAALGPRAAELMDGHAVNCHWTVYRDAVLDDSDFERIGERLDKEVVAHQGYVGEAVSRLMPFRAAVDRATKWMLEHRA
jgi:aminoglycoside N3'-acetyltransferase